MEVQLAERARPVAFDALRLKNYRAHWRSRDIGLTAMQFRIVDALHDRPGEYLTYREIYNHVRGTGFVAGYDGDIRIPVRQAMRRIRQKFAAVDPSFDAIENFAAVGYRWRP